MQSIKSGLKLVVLHTHNGNWEEYPASADFLTRSDTELTLDLLMLPHCNVRVPHLGNALVFRALHPLYLVFVILGQGKIKSG